MTMLTGKSCRVLVAQALLVDFNYVQRECSSTVIVATSLFVPALHLRTGR
jgi:hypothetical protein